uniref:Ribonuclease n=1 Tax=Mesocestoides corti TaxID=53468 RepID=A0A5K3EJL3_MESCO
MASNEVADVSEIEAEVVEIDAQEDELDESSVPYRAFLTECLAAGGNSRVESSIERLSEATRQSPCMLGIDEAGRGPVLGPMLYAGAIAPLDKHSALKAMGLMDSKQLTEERREDLLKQMLKESDWLAYTLHVISPMEITEEMLSSQKTSLNVISQNAAIGLIRSALDQCVNLKEVFVDTVGKAETYQAYLTSLFPNLKITVESKADATYPIVSAASIYAKVTRDRLLARWPKEARGSVPPGTPIGSGYPGDPLTKQYLRMCMDPIFGFPPLVRSSWATAQSLLEERGVKAVWEDEPEADEVKGRRRKRQSDGSTSISSFFKVTPARIDHSKHRQPFFVNTGLFSVENL